MRALFIISACNPSASVGKSPIGGCCYEDATKRSRRSAGTRETGLHTRIAIVDAYDEQENPN